MRKLFVSSEKKTYIWTNGCVKELLDLMMVGREEIVDVTNERSMDEDSRNNSPDISKFQVSWNWNLTNVQTMFSEKS